MIATMFADGSPEMVARLVIAATLGGIIGWERESHGQAAGLRTNMIVALGGCLMMQLSLHMEEMFRPLTATGAVRLDPGRIASYAIASMGFLGAGAIIKGKGSVRGLTTAAGLWLVAGLGLAVGAGFIVPAIATTVLSMLVLFSVFFVSKRINQDIYTSLTLVLSCEHARLSRIKEKLEAIPSLKVLTVNYRQNLVEGIVTYRLRLRCRASVARGQVVRELLTLPGLQQLAWEESEVP
ncbi:putative MgtC/SapB transporter [Megalodesulfovibrio gigas DSM 1382 = ATCC 19364]|uniref:Putative MgtC/SapB transporter n=2 Tax=Megalodesulfovibrio gigas TaxID=879 RepID=T2GDV7_MEGG1|nr:MgtC/SapB family protein [Megalodesulfovibrio gigas]AGW14062.1 putative MgtC/SapB transporter [Megalodesulfovibrio gigas DSM 1382 = ATCC 19364]